MYSVGTQGCNILFTRNPVSLGSSQKLFFGNESNVNKTERNYRVETHITEHYINEYNTEVHCT